MATEIIIGQEQQDSRLAVKRQKHIYTLITNNIQCVRGHYIELHLTYLLNT